MGLIDKNLEICDAVSVAAIAGTAVVGTGVELPASGHPINFSRNLFLVITVSTDFASAGAATVQFRVMSDSTSTIDAGTGTQHIETGAIPFATLNAAGRVILPLPEGPNAYEAYLGLVVVTGTATTTAGSINAYVTMDPENWVAYADGI